MLGRSLSQRKFPVYDAGTGGLEWKRFPEDERKPWKQVPEFLPFYIFLLLCALDLLRLMVYIHR